MRVEMLGRNLEKQRLGIRKERVDVCEAGRRLRVHSLLRPIKGLVPDAFVAHYRYPPLDRLDHLDTLTPGHHVHVGSTRGRLAISWKKFTVLPRVSYSE